MASSFFDLVLFNKSQPEKLGDCVEDVFDAVKLAGAGGGKRSLDRFDNLVAVDLVVRIDNFKNRLTGGSERGFVHVIRYHRSKRCQLFFLIKIKIPLLIGLNFNKK